MICVLVLVMMVGGEECSFCVSDGWKGMHGANVRMIGRDVTMKDVVKRHVIPLMRDIKNQMLEMTSVSEEDKCWCISWVLRYISRSEELVDDDDVAAMEALMESMQSRVWELKEESESSEEQPGKVKRRRRNQKLT